MFACDFFLSDPLIHNAFFRRFFQLGLSSQQPPPPGPGESAEIKLAELAWGANVHKCVVICDTKNRFDMKMSKLVQEGIRKGDRIQKLGCSHS